MIKRGECSICEQEKYIYSSLCIVDVCATCLYLASRRVRRHQQLIAAAEADVSDATMRIFKAAIAVADENSDGPMTLSEIAAKASRVNSVTKYHVDRLAKAGLITKSKGLARTIRLVEDPPIPGLMEGSGE